MPGRREFVKTFTKGIGGALLVPVNTQWPVSTSMSQPKSMDNEAYWRFVRTCFPLKNDFVFLNNGTMGPSPYQVIEEEARVNMDINASAQYGGKKEEALTDMARFVKVKKENIAFTHNVTEGINIGVWSLNLNKGDEVIISTHEHVGNAVPWLNRAKLDGIVLKPIPILPTAEAMLDAVKKAITKNTRVIALPHITCTTGQVLPIKEICSLARMNNIFTIVDGAHGPGMLPLDLHDMGCDMYASCCHKWMLGPKGTGFVYIRDEYIEKAIPKFIGAYGDTGWDMLSNPPKINGYVATAHRFFYGTQSASQYAGISAAIKFHEQIGIDKIERRIQELSGYLQQQLLAFGNDKIEMLSPVETASRGGSISFKLKKMDYSAVQKKCAQENIIVRGVPENGINCLRVSTHIYNNFQELDKLLALLKSLA
ncbi:MAG: aminotransferase class V-fold PLP-dependent enzyme [Ferruginibacter sp.]